MKLIGLLFGRHASQRIRLIFSTVNNDNARTHWVRWLRRSTDEVAENAVIIPAPEWSARLALKLPAYWARLYRLCQPLQGENTIFVATHFFQLPIVIWLRGKKVFDAAEMYSHNLAQYFGPFKRLVRPFIALLEGLFVSRFDGVLTVDSRGRWLERHFRRWNRHVQVVWNVPALADEPEPSLVEQLRTDYEGRRVVAYVGGLMREKGLRVALESVSILKEKYPDILFLFIGPMKDDEPYVDSMISDLYISHHVKFLDTMPYPDMIAHLRHASIGLALYQNDRHYAYVSTGNGRKFFTYMQAKLAIVGPDFGEIGKAVELTKSGVLVNAHEPQAVASAIDHLFSNPEVMRNMQNSGRRAFEDRFNWELEREKIIRFFEEMV